uniref:Uncharacterized protein n=1 Tax=Lynx canadensis TaxID=61383 RepID=A0A667GJA8_LYNCA
GSGRGRAGLRGVLRGPAGSSLWSHHGCFLTYQDGFWVPLFPPNTTDNPLSPFFWRLTDTWTPRSDFPPQWRAPFSPPLRLPYLCSEEWVPVAVGREETAGNSPPAG